MKKWICMALCLMLCLSGVAMAEETEGVKIGILLPELMGGTENAAAFYAEQRCIELGAEYMVAVCADEESMLDQLAEMQVWGVQAVVVWPQLAGDAEALQAAAEEGVAVIAMEQAVDVPGARLVQADDYDMGVQQAYYLAEKLEGVGTVAVLTAEGEAAAARLLGMKETLEEIAPSMKVLEAVTAGQSREDAAVAMSALLDGQQQIDALWVADDIMALGAYEAIQGADRTDVYVIMSCGGRQDYFRTATEREDMYLATMPRAAAVAAEAVNMAASLAQDIAVEESRMASAEPVDRTQVNDWLDDGSAY